MTSATTAPASRFASWWPWVAAVTSGVLLQLCFAPADVGGLAFVALIPLLMAVWIPQGGKRAGLRRFGLGYVAGLVFFTSTFYWLAELAPLFHSPALTGLPFLLALYLALFPAVWAWLAGWIAGDHFRPLPPPDPLAPFERPALLKSSRNLAIAIFTAAAWTALEWVRGWLLSGFGWNKLGEALHTELPLIQFVEFTGVGGPGFLLVMCNAIGLITVLRVRAEVGRIRLRPHFDFALTVALVVLAFGHGVRVLSLTAGKPPAGLKLKVASVQPNVSQEWKFDIERWPDIFERLRTLSDFAALTGPDLLLWPEAAVPGGMLADTDTEAFVRERAASVPAMMIGTDDLDRGAPGEDHNSAALLLAGEKEARFYDKRRLVPFGEFLPLRPLLGPIAGDLVPGDFKPGTQPGVFDLVKPAVKLAPLICFEDTRPEITREPVLLGAQLLVNLTNDGWFGRSAEPRQHLAISVFRCIENRRPMVRCTNTGVTAFVDAFGRVEQWMEPFTQGAATREIVVPQPAGTTFYTRNGEVFSAACAMLVGAVAGFRFTRRRVRK